MTMMAEGVTTRTTIGTGVITREKLTKKKNVNQHK